MKIFAAPELEAKLAAMTKSDREQAERLLNDFASGPFFRIAMRIKGDKEVGENTYVRNLGAWRIYYVIAKVKDGTEVVMVFDIIKAVFNPWTEMGKK